MAFFFSTISTKLFIIETMNTMLSACLTSILSIEERVEFDKLQHSQMFYNKKPNHFYSDIIVTGGLMFRHFSCKCREPIGIVNIFSAILRVFRVLVLKASTSDFVFLARHTFNNICR